VSYRLLLLVAGSLAFWLLLALPARAFGGGDEAMIVSGVTALVCLVPAALTLVWANRALGGSPEQRLVAVAGGMGFRMVVVLAAGWVLHSRVAFLREQPSFWLWLVVFYLFTLGLEMTLLLAGRSGARGS
jgi:hypothetical protein